MAGKTQRVRVLAFLFAIIFVGAQFHFCAHITSGPSNSHPCPICSATGSVVVPHPPAIARGVTVTPLEVLAEVVPFSIQLPRAVSPRAPPAL